MTIHVGKSGTAATWFWDTGVTLPGLGLLREREAAAGAVRILTAGIQPDGTPPVTYERQQYLYGYQIPLLTWGVGHYLALCPDSALLADAYEPLARYVRHWLDRYTVAHDLVIYPPGGTSLDDALRWHSGSPLTPRPGQPWWQQEWGQSRPDLYASPDINAFLYLELRTLAEMADALGKADEARGWRERAERLAAAINAWLIEPGTRTYQDRHIESGTFTGMISMASFIPVYAGIAPRESAEALCRDYLLAPEHFLTAMPFPVIDRAHPTFRSGGFLHQPAAFPGALVQQSYWRGRTWIHGDCWLLGALWQTGLRAEADAVADRILEAVSRSEGIHECYDSLTGFGNGHPEFMWSAAGVLMIAHRFYAQPPVARLRGGGKV
jgi:putative isomerase